MPGHEELVTQCPECLELFWPDGRCRVERILSERVGQLVEPGLVRLYAVTPEDHEIVATYRTQTLVVRQFWARPTPSERVHINTPYCLAPWRHQPHWPAEVYMAVRR